MGVAKFEICGGRGTDGGDSILGFPLIPDKSGDLNW